MEMKGVTREEAVLFLLSLQDQIDLIVQHRADEYDHVMTSQRGDSFYIRSEYGVSVEGNLMGSVERQMWSVEGGDEGVTHSRR